MELDSGGASLVAQMVKNPLAMWETWVRSLGWDDPLEEGMAAHSRVLPWEIPWTGEPGRLQAVGSQRVRHNLVIKQKQQYRILNLVQFSSVTQLCSTL